VWLEVEGLHDLPANDCGFHVFRANDVHYVPMGEYEGEWTVAWVIPLTAHQKRENTWIYNYRIHWVWDDRWPTTRRSTPAGASINTSTCYVQPSSTYVLPHHVFLCFLILIIISQAAVMMTARARTYAAAVGATRTAAAVGGTTERAIYHYPRMDGF
jgi:hypothetical protein